MRGTVVGERVVSQAQTEAWDKGCEQAGIGAPKGERGRFVWDARAGRLVRAEEYVAPASEDAKLHVFTDRHYEGTVSPVDGSDIGSRRRRRDHMRAHGLVDYDDAKSEAREKRKDHEKEQDRGRHEALRRAVYEVTERKRRNRR